jgi:hypothetical protein
MSEEIVWEKRNRVRILTLNRPDALNALSLSMMRREAECLEGLTGLWYQSDDPVCEPEKVSEVLTEAQFFDEFIDRYCAEREACNAEMAGPIDQGTATTTSSCALDAVAAQACLDGSWLCNTDFPGFEFPIPPSECSEVCGTSSGTTGTR